MIESTETHWKMMRRARWISGIAQEALDAARCNSADQFEKNASLFRAIFDIDHVPPDDCDPVTEQRDG